LERLSSNFVVITDRASLALMGVGVALMLQPWWSQGLRFGFFVTLGAIVVQVVVGRQVKR